MSDKTQYNANATQMQQGFDPMDSNGLLLTAEELEAVAQMRGQFAAQSRFRSPLSKLETKHVELKLLPRWPLAKTVAATGAVFLASNVWFFSLGLDAHKANATTPVATASAEGNVQAPPK